MSYKSYIKYAIWLLERIVLNTANTKLPYANMKKALEDKKKDLGIDV